MIAYFDTSALIPLLVYTEARAALAQAERLGRPTRRQLPRLVGQLDDLYGQLDRIEADDALARRAGQLAQDHALPGYDAVHLAALERIADDRTVMVTGDDDLCAAATALGVATASTSRLRP